MDPAAENRWLAALLAALRRVGRVLVTVVVGGKESEELVPRWMADADEINRDPMSYAKHRLNTTSVELKSVSCK